MPTTSRHIAIMRLNNRFTVTLYAFMALGLLFLVLILFTSAENAYFKTFYWQYWQIQPTCGIWYHEMTTFTKNTHSCTISTLPHMQAYIHSRNHNQFSLYVILVLCRYFENRTICTSDKLCFWGGKKRTKIMRKYVWLWQKTGWLNLSSRRIETSHFLLWCFYLISFHHILHCRRQNCK